MALVPRSSPCGSGVPLNRLHRHNGKMARRRAGRPVPRDRFVVGKEPEIVCMGPWFYPGLFNRGGNHKVSEREKARREAERARKQKKLDAYEEECAYRATHPVWRRMPMPRFYDDFEELWAQAEMGSTMLWYYYRYRDRCVPKYALPVSARSSAYPVTIRKISAVWSPQEPYSAKSMYVF